MRKILLCILFAAPVWAQVSKPVPTPVSAAPTVCPIGNLYQITPGNTGAGNIYGNSGTGTTCALVATPGGSPGGPYLPLTGGTMTGPLNSSYLGINTFNGTVAASTAVTAPLGTFNALVIPSDGVHAQSQALYCNTVAPSTVTNSIGWTAALNASCTPYYLNLPAVGPTAPSLLMFPALSANNSQSAFDVIPLSATVLGTNTSGQLVDNSANGFNRPIASGQTSLGTPTITSGSHSVVTVPAFGVTTFDTISSSPSGALNGVTGWAPSASGGLSVYAYPGSNTVNFDIYNDTSGTITPAAVSMNWGVSRFCNSAVPLTGGLWSQYPSNLNFASWSATGNGATASAQAYPAPDCTNNGYVLTEDSTTAQHYSIATITTTVSAGQVLHYVVFAKQVNGAIGSTARNFQMQLSNSSFSSTVSAGVSLQGCSVLNAVTTSGSWTSPTLTVTPIAPGWCEMLITVVATADTSIHPEFSMLSGSTKSYTGNSASQVVYWGASVY